MYKKLYIASLLSAILALSPIMGGCSKKSETAAPAGEGAKSAAPEGAASPVETNSAVDTASNQVPQPVYEVVRETPRVWPAAANGRPRTAPQVLAQADDWLKRTPINAGNFLRLYTDKVGLADNASPTETADPGIAGWTVVTGAANVERVLRGNRRNNLSLVAYYQQVSYAAGGNFGLELDFVRERVGTGAEAVDQITINMVGLRVLESENPDTVGYFGEINTGPRGLSGITTVRVPLDIERNNLVARTTKEVGRAWGNDGRDDLQVAFASPEQSRNGIGPYEWNTPTPMTFRVADLTREPNAIRRLLQARNTADRAVRVRAYQPSGRTGGAVERIVVVLDVATRNSIVSEVMVYDAVNIAAAVATPAPTAGAAPAAAAPAARARRVTTPRRAAARPATRPAGRTNTPTAAASAVGVQQY